MSAQSVGSLEMTLTWHYNDVIGAKGDEGAVVMLFSEPPKHKLTVNEVATLRMQVVPWRMKAEVGPSLSLTARRRLKTLGIYAAEADGDGDVVINDVPAGTYIVLALSNYATIISSDDSVSDDVATAIEPMFASKASYEKFILTERPPNATGPTPPLAWFKPYVDETTVRANQTTKLTHDFGETSI
jgi:hypothetical protein